MKRFVLGCLGVGAFGVLLAVGFFWAGALLTRHVPASSGGSARTTPTAAPVAEASNEDLQRMFLGNDRQDDTPRKVVFRRVLRKLDQRCDDVSAMNMRSRGEWRVSCAPGYVYAFRFDARGELVGMERVD